MINLLLTLVSFAAGAVAPGSSAPDFKLPASDGKTYQLSDFKGKYVVLEWLNKGCPFVKKHYSGGNMQKLQSKYKEKGVVWLSVISSAPGKQGYVDATEAKAWAKVKKASPTATLLDPKGRVGRLYGAKTTPHMYVVNPKGKLVYMGAIDSIRSADPDDIPKAVNYIDQTMDRALANKTIEVSETKPYGCSVKY